MPAPIPVPVRQALFARWEKGEAVATLADEFELSVRTVRHLVRRFAQRGQQGVVPDYERCATKKMPADQPTFQEAVKMRTQHPTWGGGLIRVLLQERGSESCPSERTLQRWFQQSSTSPAPPGRRPASDGKRARHPHDIWQMDAVDQLCLASGQKVSWLRVVDEYSGAVLQTTIFPPRFLGPGRVDARAGDVAPAFYAARTA